MNPSQQKRFNLLYQSHVKALKRQGKAKATVDAYSRAVRRVAEHFDRCPDKLTAADLKDYFSSLVQSHSWSTVKLDRNGLQFFYKHTLNKQWDWIDIVKPPQVRSLPDILTPQEVALLINSTRELRYQVYILTTYSMVAALIGPADASASPATAITAATVAILPANPIRSTSCCRVSMLRRPHHRCRPA